MVLTSGTKLGLYEIPALLGAGTGEVYRASVTRLDRKVGVKLPPQSVTDDAYGLQRSVPCQLNYPNLLSIFDVGTQGGIHYLVSEILEGQTLRVRFSSSALP